MISSPYTVSAPYRSASNRSGSVPARTIGAKIVRDRYSESARPAKDSAEALAILIFQTQYTGIYLARTYLACGTSTMTLYINMTSLS